MQMYIDGSKKGKSELMRPAPTPLRAVAIPETLLASYAGQYQCGPDYFDPQCEIHFDRKSRVPAAGDRRSLRAACPIFWNTKSADGRVATVATRLGKKRNDSPKPRRIDLTPTGLLMEGHYTQNPCSGHFEGNRSFCEPIRILALLHDERERGRMSSRARSSGHRDCIGTSRSAAATAAASPTPAGARPATSARDHSRQ
jgi:hypothetical protein